MRRFWVNSNIRLGLLAVLCLMVLVPGYLSFKAITTPTSETRQVITGQWQHSADWDYSVFLKPNSLFAEDSLGPGATYFDTLTEGMEARLTYSYTSDLSSQVEGWYEVEATMVAEDLWEKSSFLFPRTNFQEKVPFTLDLDFPVDRQAYEELIAEIEEETEIRPRSTSVVFTARVHTKAVDGQGPSGNDVLEPTIIVPLNSSSFEITGVPSKSNQQTVKRTEREVIAGVEGRRKYTVLATVLLALIPLIFVLVTTSAPLADNPVTQRALALLQRYKKRIAVATHQDLVPVSEVVALQSMEGLVRVSDETLKPIIYYASGNPGHDHRFYILDGAVRYEYKLCYSANGTQPSEALMADPLRVVTDVEATEQVVGPERPRVTTLIGPAEETRATGHHVNGTASKLQHLETSPPNDDSSGPTSVKTKTLAVETEPGPESTVSSSVEKQPEAEVTAADPDLCRKESGPVKEVVPTRELKDLQRRLQQLKLLSEYPKLGANRPR